MTKGSKAYQIINQDLQNSLGSQEWGESEPQDDDGESQEWPYDPEYNHPDDNSIYDTPGEHQAYEDTASANEPNDEDGQWSLNEEEIDLRPRTKRKRSSSRRSRNKKRGTKVSRK